MLLQTFYWSRIYSKQIHRGDEYTKARKVVIIAITDFEIDITKELKRMLNDNLEIEMIKKYTNATDEEIEEVKATK